MSWLRPTTLQSDRLTAVELHSEEACVLQISHLQQTGGHFSRQGGHFSRRKACRRTHSQCFVTVGASDTMSKAGSEGLLGSIVHCKALQWGFVFRLMLLSCKNGSDTCCWVQRA